MRTTTRAPKTARLVVTVAGLAAVTTGCAAPAAPTPTTTVVVVQAPQPPVTVLAPPPAANPSVVAPVPAPTPADVMFTMPDVVGMVLQDAQDKLQAEGSYLMDQRDASGRGRRQVLDRDWKVCTQDPAAGTAVSVTAMVVLASVKLDETCP